MYEILSRLRPGSLVLDLGSGAGSFATSAPLTVIRADLELPRSPVGQTRVGPMSRGTSNFIRCSAAGLPFRNQSFHAVICNHSLEHFEDLENSIREIVRVLAPHGYLYIAVPDASTITDRLYRWLARGGGHVNAFSDVRTIPRLIAAAAGPSHAGTRLLCTSLSFLNRRNLTSRPPRKALLVGYGNENVLRFLTLGLKHLDRFFHTRTCIYGWAYYFGDFPDLDCAISSNVCVKCGSAHPSSWLEQTGRVTRRLSLAAYSCPSCETWNFFTEDRYWQSLK
jgi:ubiquinone/menaquinone biosynthesis C-methylase UbiE